MQTMSFGDNLHEMSNPVSVKNKKNILICRLLKYLSRVLRVIGPIMSHCSITKTRLFKYIENFFSHHDEGFSYSYMYHTGVH